MRNTSAFNSFALENEVDQLVGDGIMKKLIAATVLTIAIASPALSQTVQRQAREQTYGRQIAKTERLARSASSHQANRPCAAYSQGSCLGWDPDPRVRMMLRMDAHLNDD
jgi:hypothetical protein